MIVGIDYGAKLAGTTVICYGDCVNNLQIYTVEKKQDADKFILDFLSIHECKTIGIDAPLSLPPGVLGNGGDYFYRNCDTSLCAMSPMFIGGLTARAMKLKNEIKSKYDCTIIEVYPKAVVNHVLDKEIALLYNKGTNLNIDDFLHLMIKYYNINALPKPKNWHQVDAILAWFSTYRFIQSQHISFGDHYGQIIV